MEQQVAFEYTLTAKYCIESLVAFLRQANVAPRPVISDILNWFETTVGQFSASSQIWPDHPDSRLNIPRHKAFLS